VAERLDMTKQFIYSHYKTKGEILVEICASGARHSLDVVEQALALEVAPTEKLKCFARDYARVICEQQSNVTIYLREEKNLSDSEAQMVHGLRRTFDERLSMLLEEGVRAGEFDIPDIRLTTLAIGGMIGWATFWYRPNGRLSMPDLMDGMMDLVLRTVSAEPYRRPGVGR
jgi:TetR/AcrR family transcriptional regulator, cholesterol catabolism regulator